VNWPQQEKCLGHRVGEAVELGLTNGKKEKVWRYYIPLSRLDEQGGADFMIKMIEGEFSSLLKESAVGQKLSIRGPSTGWVYKGFGNIEYLGGVKHNQPPRQGTFDTLVMIAHDTGITAFFNLLDTIADFKEDKTKLSLVYVVDSIEDLALPDELLSLQEEGRVAVQVVLNEQPKGIQEKDSLAESLEEAIPLHNNKTAFLVCGKRSFVAEVNEILEKIPRVEQYKENIFVI